MGKAKDTSSQPDEIMDCLARITKAMHEITECSEAILTAMKVRQENPGNAKAEKSATVPESKESKEPVKTKEPEKTYTKEEVRTVLSGKSSAENGKYRADVKALVRKYADGGSLTDVKPEDYAALIRETEVLGDA
jgi:hypothetical protein